MPSCQNSGFPNMAIIGLLIDFSLSVVLICHSLALFNQNVIHRLQKTRPMLI
jgi:hypothetical protein